MDQVKNLLRSAGFTCTPEFMTAKNGETDDQQDFSGKFQGIQRRTPNWGSAFPVPECKNCIFALLRASAFPDLKTESQHSDIILHFIVAFVVIKGLHQDFPLLFKGQMGVVSYQISDPAGPEPAVIFFA